MLSLLHKRHQKIISILLFNQHPTTSKQLAKELDVSSRTIRNDLKKIKDVLQKKQFNLMKKPGVGVWLELNSKQKKELCAWLKENLDNSPLSPEKRKQFILKKLLQSENEYLTIESLVKDTQVSRTTIYNDIKKIENWLNNYQLELKKKKHYGLKITGSEKAWRKAVSNLLIKFKDDSEIKKLLNESQSSNSIRRNNQIQSHLETLIEKINFQTIEEILAETEKKLDYSFTEEAFVSLTVHIAISIERLTKNKTINMKEKQLNNLKKNLEFEVAEFISQQLKQKLGIVLPESEIGYMSLHILGSKIQHNINNTDLNKVLKNADSQVLKIARKIISTAEKILEVDLSNDNKLLLGLVLHLRPTITRLKYGMNLRNPILEDIKSDYPEIFGAVWATSSIFKEYLNVQITEEEIGYIALHIGAALERTERKYKVIIVCSSGIGTAQVIATRLKKRLPFIKIMDTCSAHEITKCNLEDIDLVISSVPLKNYSLNIELVNITPLLSEQDLNSIRQKLSISFKKNHKIIKNYRKLKENKTSSLLTKEIIIPKLNLNSKEKIINYLGSQLVACGAVKKEYIQEVMKREKLTSTAIGKGIAIPHANSNKVKNPQLAVATMYNPIDWNGESVDLVFLLALNNVEEDIKYNFFKKFTEIIDNSQLLNQIKKSDSKQKIKQILLS